MGSIKPSSQDFFARLWRWLKNQLVVEVPAESAVCEFDCRKEQCRYDEWATCQRRLSYMTGEYPPKQGRSDRT